MKTMIAIIDTVDQSKNNPSVDPIPSKTRKKMTQNRIAIKRAKEIWIRSNQKNYNYRWKIKTKAEEN